MEPNKFDHRIKEKLEVRSITPSADAWGKLDAMLDTAKNSKSKKRSRSWLFIAAGLIGFLFLTTVFNLDFDSNLIQKGAPVVVDQNKEELPEKEKLVKEEVVVSVKVGTKKSQTIQVVAVNSNPKKKTNSAESQVVAAVVSNVLSKKEGKVVDPIVKEIASESSNKYISATELLATVTNAKLDKTGNEKTTNFPKQSYTVNPNSLLSNAETELNQTFRETALIKLSKNFNSIKTVLVNRNYEE